MIGMVEVATFSASTEGVSGVAITASLRPTKSVANAGNRSFWPSAQRYSIASPLTL
jgi:hypothetical protein